MSKVKKITVSNLKAVSNLTADFNGCSAIITGANHKGKTSFLRSIPDRIRGIKPDVVLKHGESEGSAEMELTTGEKFIWEFSGKKEKLTYVSDRNIPGAVTKEIAGAYFPKTFDVDKFLNSGPKDQKKELQKLTGIDFTEIDSQYKHAYDTRTYANSRVTETKAKLVFYDPKLTTEALPLEEKQAELAGIDAHNLRYSTVDDKVKEKQAKILENSNEILELELKITKLKKSNTELSEEIGKGDTWMKEDKNKPKTNQQELQQEITTLKEQNKLIEENNRAKLLQDEYDKAVLNANEADTEVKRIEAEKLEVIKNASMPEGFGFDEDGITYKGFPFNRQSLSSSDIYIAALKLAALTLGSVEMLHFDASFLDKNSLMDVEKWAESEGKQLLIERPSWEGGEISYELIQTL